MSKSLMFPKETADVRGNFEDFPASKLEVVVVKPSRKNPAKRFIITQDANGSRHNIMAGELTDLQDRNPGVDVLINAEGKRVEKDGDECTLNPNLAIGREGGVLTL